jgi:hypothetical protein
MSDEQVACHVRYPSSVARIKYCRLQFRSHQRPPSRLPKLQKRESMSSACFLLAHSHSKPKVTGTCSVLLLQNSSPGYIKILWTIYLCDKSQH